MPPRARCLTTSYRPSLAGVGGRPFHVAIVMCWVELGQARARSATAVEMCPAPTSELAYNRPVAASAGKATATRLGSYEILHMFAQGGMAELYLARSVGLEGFEKLVVLKRILPSFAQNAKFVRLFLDEAKLAASLDHPGIAHVYDLGLVDGNYFFTMEYVHGQDLRRVLHRSTKLGKLPIEHLVQISRTVAAALHYAHERRGPDGKVLGIVHRDVSPANIVVSYEGGVKLLDFGVAKAATSMVKTRTGTLKGKVAYMSPEQAKGATIDRRSDIFSTGIVMWEMVATQRLFKAENDLATLQLVINKPPPPLTAIRRECPRELDRIIQKALAQDPEKRYQSAQDLQSDLDELARESKLNQSSIGLSQHMVQLFGDEIAAWQNDQAAGLSLAEHVVKASETRTFTPAGEENPFGESEDAGQARGIDEEQEEQTVKTPIPRPNPLFDGPPKGSPKPNPLFDGPPGKPKRKKAKEPKDWASQPSIVVEDEELAHDPADDVATQLELPTVAPAAPPVEVQPRAYRSPGKEALKKTQIVDLPPSMIVRPRRSRAAIVIGLAAGVIAAAIAFVVIRSKTEQKPAEPAAAMPVPVEPVEVETPPTPAPAPPVEVKQPEPTTSAPVATPEPAKPEPVAKDEPPKDEPPKEENAPVKAKPRPKAKKKEPKEPNFDPDAPLPPM